MKESAADFELTTWLVLPVICLLRLMLCKSVEGTAALIDEQKQSVVSSLQPELYQCELFSFHGRCQIQQTIFSSHLKGLNSTNCNDCRTEPGHVLHFKAKWDAAASNPF